MSERQGHAVDLARRAAEEGARLVVAVGGDGTVNEVANGLLGFEGERPELAVIARGTGTDFVRHFRIPTKLEGAVRWRSRGRCGRSTPAASTTAAGAARTRPPTSSTARAPG